MSKQPKVVAWTSTEEYLNVSECLYSADIAERKRGVAIVKAWRARSRLPVAIEATASLVEMSIVGQERNGVNITQLRHMYAMALIRFVNTIVDLEQRGTYAQSIVSLAGRIGMPAWFVELRHAGTHETLPSLAALQSACHQALGWLNDYYWNKQTRTLPPDTQIHVREALSKYLAVQKKTPVTKRARKPSKKPTSAQLAMEAASDELKQFISNLHQDAVRLCLIPVLLEPGFLVPKEKKQRAAFPECKIPQALEAQWSGLLLLLAECIGETLFFEELLSATVAILTPDASEHGIFELSDSTPSSSHAATLVSWIRWVLEAHYSSEDAEDANEAAIPINIDGVLESCLRNPSYFSRSVLKVLSQFDVELKRDLKPFVDYMGKALAALASMDAAEKNSAAKTTRKIGVMSESAMEQEERLMAERLEKHFGSAAVGSAQLDDGQDESSMEVDEVSGNTQSTQPNSATDTAISPPTDSAGGASGSGSGSAPVSRWSYMPQSSWSTCPIGTVGLGDIPCLEWPAWTDDVRPELVS
ncbi:rRNA-processing protein las1 [Coemansia sp. RSA 1722]|nr:rRNA-processing protein las1 [Coemansia sp. RSA 485]KAJ2600753.1 rRNA-processing protein las1 [Coemansia sp. RSA 1722]